MDKETLKKKLDLVKDLNHSQNNAGKLWDIANESYNIAYGTNHIACEKLKMIFNDYHWSYDDENRDVMKEEIFYKSKVVVIEQILNLIQHVDI